MGLTVQEVTTFVPSLADAPAATLSAILPVAIDLVEKYCNRNFLIDTVIERYEPRASGKLFLRRTPVSNISRFRLMFSSDPIKSDSCGYITADEPEITDQTVSQVQRPIAYRLESSTGLVTIVSQDSMFTNNSCYYYEIEYTGGFSDYPNPVKLATSMLIQDIYARIRTDSAYQSERIGDYSYVRSPAVAFISSTTPVSQMLKPFVRFGANGI